MSVNAVSLTHIPLSPPTDRLPRSLFPCLCSRYHYPTFLQPGVLPFSFSPFTGFISVACFFSPPLCFHISPWISFLHKASLIFFISLLHLRILISSHWYSLLCPLLSLHVTTSWEKMADTFWRLLLSPLLTPASLLYLSVLFLVWWLLSMGKHSFVHSIMLPPSSSLCLTTDTASPLHATSSLCRNWSCE